MNDTAPTLIVTPTPPDPAADSTAVLRFDFKLHRRPVTELTVSLPIGTAESDLILDKHAAEYVEIRVGTDERYTPKTKTAPPKIERVWSKGKTVSDKSLKYTFKPLPGHNTNHFTFTLTDVHLNQTKGSAVITATVSEGGSSTTLTREVKKSSSTFDCDNFELTGNTTKVVAGAPLNLTWTANNAKSFDLVLADGSSRTLQSHQRAYPDPTRPTDPPLTVSKDGSSFKLTAHGPNGEIATKQIPNIQVFPADGDYKNLTVTGKLTYPEQETVARDYFLNSPLEFTTPSCGYLTIDLEIYTRLFGCFPATKNLKPPAPHAALQATLELTGHGQTPIALAMTAVDGTPPVTIFAPAQMKIKITPLSVEESLTLKNYFTSLIKASVTWTRASQNTQAPVQIDLPDNRPYTFRQAEALPIKYISTDSGEKTVTVKTTETTGKVDSLYTPDDRFDTALIRWSENPKKTKYWTTQNVRFPAAEYQLKMYPGKTSMTAWLESSNKMHLRAQGGPTGATLSRDFDISVNVKDIGLFLTPGKDPTSPVSSPKPPKIIVTNGRRRGDSVDPIPRVRVSENTAKYGWLWYTRDYDHDVIHDLCDENFTGGFLYVKIERCVDPGLLSLKFEAFNGKFFRQVRAEADWPSSPPEFDAYHIGVKCDSRPAEYTLTEKFKFEGDQPLIFPRFPEPLPEANENRDLQEAWNTAECSREGASRPNPAGYGFPLYPTGTTTVINLDTVKWDETTGRVASPQYQQFPLLESGTYNAPDLQLKITDTEVTFQGNRVDWVGTGKVDVAGFELAKDGVIKIPE
ncbi:hypothetical protein [Streptomyces wuyuanensis]|uniref:hypothetical protein n=1 Tax=Streptomyces wuyuanensis TaxID=1196353 RepID=UPI003438EAAF